MKPKIVQLRRAPRLDRRFVESAVRSLRRHLRAGNVRALAWVLITDTDDCIARLAGKTSVVERAGMARVLESHIFHTSLEHESLEDPSD